MYNLCSERDYSNKHFHGRIRRFPFDDHNPPSMDMMLRACKDLLNYLEPDPERCAAVHCKAGKGRTGTIIAAYMVYNKQYFCVEDSLMKYAIARTQNIK